MKLVYLVDALNYKLAMFLPYHLDIILHLKILLQSVALFKKKRIFVLSDQRAVRK